VGEDGGEEVAGSVVQMGAEAFGTGEVGREEENRNGFDEPSGIVSRIVVGSPTPARGRSHDDKLPPTPPHPTHCRPRPTT
jgi:hypothetical protein